jgi:hypothetical protein
MTISFAAHQLGEARIAALLVFLEAAHFQKQQFELLFGRAAVGALDGDALAHLPRQTGNSHHEELVQIGGGDGEEPDPLQQRWQGFCDSSRTRRLNWSHENSRLTKRSGLPSGAAESARISPVNSLVAGLSSFIASTSFSCPWAAAMPPLYLLTGFYDSLISPTCKDQVYAANA